MYDFIVKQDCFIPNIPIAFLSDHYIIVSQRSRGFPSLSIIPYWDFDNYPHNYPILSLSPLITSAQDYLFTTSISPYPRLQGGKSDTCSLTLSWLSCK